MDTRPLSLTGLWGHPEWNAKQAVFDHNVIWHGGLPIEVELDAKRTYRSLLEWQAAGHDRNSIVADPRFVAAAHLEQVYNPHLVYALNYPPGKSRFSVDIGNSKDAPAQWYMEFRDWRDRLFVGPTFAGSADGTLTACGKFGSSGRGLGVIPKGTWLTVDVDSPHKRRRLLDKGLYPDTWWNLDVTCDGRIHMEMTESGTMSNGATHPATAARRWGSGWDPVKVFNVYGFNTCGNDSICLGTLWKQAGFSTAPAYTDPIRNGLWEYRPDLSRQVWRQGATTVKNIRWDRGGLTAEEGKTGSIVWTMRSPYVLVGGRIEAEGDGARFFICQDGRPWQEVSGGSLDKFFSIVGPPYYEYQVTCELGKGASLNKVAIINDVHMAPMALVDELLQAEFTDAGCLATRGRRGRGAAARIVAPLGLSPILVLEVQESVWAASRAARNRLCRGLHCQ